MKQTYRLFGLWRLLAAILVMLYHFAHHARAAASVTAWFENMAPLLDMFFIMSGFLIFEHYGGRPLTRANYLHFLARRLSRLYPLHLMTLSVFVIAGIGAHMGLFATGMLEKRYAWSDLPANILLIQAWNGQENLSFNYVSWSLSAEWFAYLVFPIVVFAFLRGRMLGLALLLAVLVLALEWADAGALTKDDRWYEWRTLGAYRVAADFVFGALLCVIVREHAIALRSQAPAWIAMVAVFVSMFGGAHTYVSFAAIGLAMYLAACVERTNPDATAWIEPLTPVTAVSFGVYLWHPILELLFYSLIWTRLLPPMGDTAFWAYTLLPVLATLGVALFSAYYLERPIGKWMQTTMTGWLDRHGQTPSSQSVR